MNTRKEKSQVVQTAARPSTRPRRGLLFQGNHLETTVMSLAAFLDPKLPPFRGE